MNLLYNFLWLSKLLHLLNFWDYLNYSHKNLLFMRESIISCLLSVIQRYNVIHAKIEKALFIFYKRHEAD
jgi:hypothetical protein